MDAAIYALLAAADAGWNAGEDGREGIESDDIAFGLRLNREGAAVYRTDRERLRPLARRLVALIRSEAMHDAAALVYGDAADHAALGRGPRAGLLRETAERIERLARTESPDAD